MPVFKEREQAFEAEFVHGRQVAFDVKARRNRMIYLWAARKMGLTGQAAERYALEAVGDEMGHNDDAVVTRLLSDLRARGINIGEQKLRSELLKCSERAHQEITGRSSTLP